MNWEELQNVIRATDAQYNAGNDSAKQAAVAAREAAVSQWQAGQIAPAYKGTITGNAPASYPPPPPPVPVYVPPPPPPAPTTFSVKQAEPDIILFDAEAVPQEVMTDLIFEDIGGTELINMSRNDTVNGQEVIYSIIKRLSILNKSFNPNNILAGQSSGSAFFNQYALDIVSRLPEFQAVYLDEEGNLVIDFESIGPDEYAEAEISSNGTIYKIEVA